MIIFLTTLHVVTCLFLIIVVLLQSGKAADLAGAFGGMGSQTAFGPRGAATVLSKATTIAAVLFMLTSISLGIIQGNRGGGTGQSVIEQTGLDAPVVDPTSSTGAPTGGTANSVPLPGPGESQTLDIQPEVVITPQDGQAPAAAEPEGEKQ
jgi:preprotein translocase subunit SecG